MTGGPGWRHIFAVTMAAFTCSISTRSVVPVGVLPMKSSRRVLVDASATNLTRCLIDASWGSFACPPVTRGAERARYEADSHCRLEEIHGGGGGGASYHMVDGCLRIEPRPPRPLLIR